MIGAEPSRSEHQHPIQGPEVKKDEREGRLISLMFDHNKKQRELEAFERRGFEPEGSHIDDAPNLERLRTEVRKSMDEVNDVIAGLQVEFDREKRPFFAQQIFDTSQRYEIPGVREEEDSKAIKRPN